MLRSLKDREQCKVSTLDRDIGCVVDAFLDLEHWVVRYLVAEASRLLNERQVHVSPTSIRHVDWSTKRFNLALTRDKAKDSPSALTRISQLVGSTRANTATTMEIRTIGGRHGSGAPVHTRDANAANAALGEIHLLSFGLIDPNN